MLTGTNFLKVFGDLFLSFSKTFAVYFDRRLVISQMLFATKMLPINVVGFSLIQGCELCPKEHKAGASVPDQYIRKQDGVHVSSLQTVGLSGIQMAFEKPDHLAFNLFSII